MAKRTPMSSHRIFKTRLKAVFPSTVFALVAVILLLVFKVTVPLAERSVRANLPEASVEPISPRATRTITIGLNGAISLDGRSVGSDELIRHFKALAAQSPQPVLKVRGARNLPYRDIKEIIDLAQSVGIGDVRIEVAPNHAAGTYRADQPSSTL